MGTRISRGGRSIWLVLAICLLWATAAAAQGSSRVTVCFYREGQLVPVAREGVLVGDPQADAAALIAALLAGPSPTERASGLTSALPFGTESIAVTVSGNEVTIDLRIPPDFLRGALDANLSDAIVEQIAKTLYPLDLFHIQIRALDEEDTPRPVSDFLPRVQVPAPTLPANEEPLPDRWGPLDRAAGQPPAPGQGQPQGALTGTGVWLSAGHGWYWSESLNRWTTQRGNNNGLVEDLSNAEAVNAYLAHYLWNAGADVWLVRERGMTPHEVIVDDDDGAPGYTQTGPWTVTSYPGTGYNAGDYRYATTYADALTARATWTPNLPQAGWYPVWAWYRHGANRPADARYEVHHAGGVTTVSLSQEVHGQTWRFLGEYYFKAGQAGHVTLVNQSSDPGQAVIADAVRFGGGMGSIEEPGGSSGRPRWEEAAKYWARTQGAPPEITTSDATSRPLYAEWEAAKGYAGEAENSVYISWHSNAYNGVLTGTMSFIHSTEPTPGSAQLQDWVHAELISDLRAAWDPNWADRNQRSADYGELRELTSIPGVLLEVAFHDSPSDASALREPVFRQIAARAVYQGIVRYQAQRQSRPVRLLPEPPERLVARNTAPGEVTLTWSAPPCCDGVAGDAASGYKVYHSTNGRAFDNGLATDQPSLKVGGLERGSLHFFRVTALNAGGESFATPVVAVGTPLLAGAVDFLVVDGFDRLDQAAMIPQWEAPFLGTAQRMFLERMNRYDYAVEHGQALSACGRSFDGAVNEAVEAGDVSLAGYHAVDWFTGEDSTADAALSDTERTLLSTYLDNGGRLLLSGSEIGYDLVEQGRDPAFFQDVLHAQYLGDDADSYQFAGVPGGLFEGLAGSFDDSTSGTYDVDYPDRLGSAAGSQSVLTYQGGSGGSAAVAYAGVSRVVHLGFPLETVTDRATRSALFCRSADFLLPADPEPDGIPRLINPGFEQGQGQPVWQTATAGSRPVLYRRDQLPAYVQPYEGDWLAWLGAYTPGLDATTILTQVVALPAGEPTATLHLAWFVQPQAATAPAADRLALGLYDLEGILQAELLTLTGESPAGAWRTSAFDVSAFAGQTVQVAFHTTSSDTAFFVDDVQLTTAGPAGPDEFRALWVDAYHDGIKSRQQIETLIETAQAGNFNALVVQVRRRGDTYYPSAIDPWAPDADRSFDALATLIDRAHAAGIEVHAWATTLAIWGGDTRPADPAHTFNLHGPDASGRDFWLMTSDSGGIDASGVTYLDPGHPDVVDDTVAVYAELAANYDLDGVHLDRVRYAWQNWGYNPTAVARFQAQTGRTDVPPPTDVHWLQWRRDQVTALVRRIYLAVTAIDPGLRVSAALSASGGPPTASTPWETRTPYTHQLQDWRAWLEEGIVDLALPMTYKRDPSPTERSQFDGWIAWQKEHQYGRGVAVGTALYLNSLSDSMAQWLRVRQPTALEARALGVCGYSYATPSNDGLSGRALANAAIGQVFTQTASPPALAWKDTASLGHLLGQLSRTLCQDRDGTPVHLTGPAERLLIADGSGWFGAVDLPPGDYVMSVEIESLGVTVEVPVIIEAGRVSQPRIHLPSCASSTIDLPLMLKQAGP